MNRNVLIVEDNDLFARLYGSLFRPLDCAVVHVRTKTDALRLLETERPNLIVMGLHFRDGSGIDAIRVIRSLAAQRETPIIAMALRASSTDEAELKDAGCTAFVSRPLRLDEFTALARRYIDQPAAKCAHAIPTSVWAGFQTDLSPTLETRPASGLGPVLAGALPESTRELALSTPTGNLVSEGKPTSPIQHVVKAAAKHAGRPANRWGSKPRVAVAASLFGAVGVSITLVLYPTSLDLQTDEPVSHMHRDVTVIASRSPRSDVGSSAIAVAYKIGIGAAAEAAEVSTLASKHESAAQQRTSESPVSFATVTASPAGAPANPRSSTAVAEPPAPRTNVEQPSAPRFDAAPSTALRAADSNVSDRIERRDRASMDFGQVVNSRVSYGAHGNRTPGSVDRANRSARSTGQRQVAAPAGWRPSALQHVSTATPLEILDDAATAGVPKASAMPVSRATDATASGPDERRNQRLSSGFSPKSSAVEHRMPPALVTSSATLQSSKMGVPSKPFDAPIARDCTEAVAVLGLCQPPVLRTTDATASGPDERRSQRLSSGFSPKSRAVEHGMPPAPVTPSATLQSSKTGVPSKPFDAPIARVCTEAVAALGLCQPDRR